MWPVSDLAWWNLVWRTPVCFGVVSQPEPASCSRCWGFQVLDQAGRIPWFSSQTFFPGYSGNCLSLRRTRDLLTALSTLCQLQFTGLFWWDPWLCKVVWHYFKCVVEMGPQIIKKTNKLSLQFIRPQVQPCVYFRFFFAECQWEVLAAADCGLGENIICR